MGSKKTARKPNPRNRPATWADVEKAYKHGYAEGMDSGIDRVFSIFLYIFADKHNATQEELHMLADEFRYYVDSMNQKYLTIEDIRKTLKEEYDVSWTIK